MKRARQLLTIKDLAQVLDMPPKWVWTNQAALGLQSAKVRFTAKVIRYRRDEVAKLPKFVGLVLPE